MCFDRNVAEFSEAAGAATVTTATSSAAGALPSSCSEHLAEATAIATATTLIPRTYNAADCEKAVRRGKL